MPEPTVMMEVERVMNLVSGFGWSKTKEEIIEEEVHITIKKKMPAAAGIAGGVGAD